MKSTSIALALIGMMWVSDGGASWISTKTEFRMGPYEKGLGKLLGDVGKELSKHPITKRVADDLNQGLLFLFVAALLMALILIIGIIAGIASKRLKVFGSLVFFGYLGMFLGTLLGFGFGVSFGYLFGLFRYLFGMTMLSMILGGIVGLFLGGKVRGKVGGASEWKEEGDWAWGNQASTRQRKERAKEKFRSTREASTSDKADVSALVASLHASDQEARREAAKALSQMESVPQEAAPALFSALKEKDWEVGVEAAKALGKAEPSVKEAVPALIAALTHQEPNVRVAAIRSLVRLGTPAKEAIPALTVSLNDEDWPVRESAARALEILKKLD